MENITDKLKNKKWGVMVHLLHYLQNNPERANNEGVGRTSWDEVITQIDVENIAKELSEMGAGYLLITTQQGNQNMSAPNATFDEITGYQAGEACAKRDVFLDLYEALKPHGIDLYLYFTGDGPYQDEKAGRALGFTWLQTMIRIVLPQAVKNIIPAIGNEMIALLKETSIIGWVGSTPGSLTFDLNAAASTIFRSVPNYLASGLIVGCFYLVIVYIMVLIVKLIERRFAKNER